MCALRASIPGGRTKVALSLRERRRRIFRYQNGESLSWFVAQARHWPDEYVRHHWNRLAEVRERLG